MPNWERIREVHYGDPLYPRHLMGLPHVPIRLFYMGELQTSDSVSVAVIGSRRASEEGKQRAYRLASELACAGVTVISGLAEGIAPFPSGTRAEPSSSARPKT